MVRPGAYVAIICEQCKITEAMIELFKVSAGTWDDRQVNGELEFRGWKISDKDICPDCVEQSERDWKKGT